MATPRPVRTNKTEDQITSEVVERFEGTPDPRLRRIMQSLVRHAHAFVKDVELTEAEWFQAIQFLTRTGQMCSDKRQEFILLSDTLGISMVVDLICHRKDDGITESTVFGPFHREGVPEVPMGSNIATGDPSGEPAVMSGRVLDPDGKPIKDALLDVWQADSAGLYDSQHTDTDNLRMRGIFRTGADGGYHFRTSRPVAYPIPDDGPVGDMLKASKRHPWRPAHVHFMVTAPGFDHVTTHVFESADKYLQSDTVFGVKESLITDFVRCETPDELAAGMGIAGPYYKASYDFILQPMT